MQCTQIKARAFGVQEATQNSVIWVLCRLCSQSMLQPPVAWTLYESQTAPCLDVHTCTMRPWVLPCGGELDKVIHDQKAIRRKQRSHCLGHLRTTSECAWLESSSFVSKLPSSSRWWLKC